MTISTGDGPAGPQSDIAPALDPATTETPPLEVVVVTGLSGAGKNSAGRVLEDLGWFVVDNLPPALLLPMVELGARGDIRRFAAGQEYRRKVRTLTGVIQVCAWLPKVLDPIANPIWLQFVFHKLLRLLTPYLAVLVLASGVWTAGSAIARTRLGLPLFIAAGSLSLLLCLIPHVRRTLLSLIHI